MESELSASDERSEAYRTPSIASEPPHNQDGPSDRPALELLTNAEGRVLLVGVALAVSFLAWLGFKVVTAPAQSRALLLITMLTATVGRPTAIEVGYAMELPSPLIFWIAALVETAAVLIFYPLAAFSCQQLVAVKPLQKAFRRLHDAAQRHKASIRRYGPIGLFVFVMAVPYGSPIGAVIGFLLDMPIWLNLATVLSATCIATLLWTVFLHHLHAFVSSYGPHATMILVAALIGVTVIGHLRHRATRLRQAKT